eukprot:m.235224 g.235224  ORF g.235224 m.235224 type:complete len:123 (+) comp15259_c0_seq10:157-525(+)
MRWSWLVWAVVGAAASYAFYFDYKRTRHPEYKQNLIAKRQAEQRAKKQQELIKRFSALVQQGFTLAHRGPANYDNAARVLFEACKIYENKEAVLSMLLEKVPLEVYQRTVSLLQEYELQNYP